MLRNFGSIISSKDEAFTQNSAVGTAPHAQEMSSGYGLKKRIEPFFEKKSRGPRFFDVTKCYENSAKFHLAKIMARQVPERYACRDIEDVSENNTSGQILCE